MIWKKKLKVKDVLNPNPLCQLVASYSKAHPHSKLPAPPPHHDMFSNSMGQFERV